MILSINNESDNIKRGYNLEKSNSKSSTDKAAYSPDLLLISMPFGLPHMPSLGLSTLKAELTEQGINAGVQYMFTDYVNTLGFRLYQKISQGHASFLGEWIFRPALFGYPTQAEEDEFWELFSDIELAEELNISFQELKDQITRAQEEAIDYIESCLNKFDWSTFKMVGFTTMFQQNIASLALAKRIKETEPGTVILFGGANCEDEMGAALLRNFRFIDFVFSGEADYTLPAFAKAILNNEDPPELNGLIRRDQKSKEVLLPENLVNPTYELDDLPIPDFDDFFEQYTEINHKIRPHLNFECARGCWWGAKNHCTFCGLLGSTMTFRKKSPDRVLKEIAYLHKKYVIPHGVVLLRAADQILEMKYFDTVLPKLQEVAPGVPLFFEVKSNLNYDRVKLMADAKITMIQPGVESLSTPILKLMRKGATMLQNIQTLKWCAEIGILPIWNMIYGFPGEDRAEYEKIVTLIPKLTHLQPPKGLGQVRLDRFSPYFTEPEQHGVIKIRPRTMYKLMYPFPSSELEKLAYHFSFDYADNRTMEYAAEMKELLRKWQNQSNRGVFVGFYKDEALLIWDTRPASNIEWTLVDGIYKKALEFCDQIRKKKQILQLFEKHFSPEEAEVKLNLFLTEMEERNLIIKEDVSYLSLLVLNRTAPAPAIPDQLIERLTAHVEAPLEVQ